MQRQSVTARWVKSRQTSTLSPIRDDAVEKQGGLTRRQHAALQPVPESAGTDMEGQKGRRSESVLPDAVPSALGDIDKAECGVGRSTMTDSSQP